MNPIVEEMNDILIHYGMPRRSGRYPWGSGENPYQHSIDFLGRIETLKKSGWSETPENIKNEFGLTTTQYRAQKSLAKDERRMYDVARAKSLSKDGLGPTEIGKIMGINESSVRSLLDSNSESRMLKAIETADFIKKQLEIYAALFCLEYKVKPGDIDIELRIDQNDEILYHRPTAEDILPIMDTIVHLDKLLEKIDQEED